MRCLLPEFMAGKAANQSGLLDMKVGTDSGVSWYRRMYGIWALILFFFSQLFFFSVIITFGLAVC